MATILIVDDLAANRKLLVSMLAPAGHRLLEAADGREALAAVRGDQPDLVITDVLMPVMDGYELVRQMRRDSATSAVPVVFCTAHYGEREARTLALSIGVSDVVTKPAETERVLQIVGRVLSGEVTAPPPDPAAVGTEFDREHLRLLTDQLCEKAEDLRTANTRLRALINIGLELASERDASRLLQRVCVAAHDLFAPTYVILGIVDRNDGTVQRVVSSGADAANWVEVGDSLSGILRTVVTERRPWRSDDREGYPTGLPSLAQDLNVHALLAAPIASPLNAYGWICLVNNEGRTFTEDDEQLVLALAGQLGRIYALEDEIRQREQEESAARRERDRTQQYLDTAEVLLLALDLDGRISLINRKGCELLGWPEAELVGEDWFERCLPARIRDAHREKFRELVAGAPMTAENPVLTRAGEERLVEWHHTLLYGESRRIVGTFSSGTDITERRLLEQQYRQAQKMEALGWLAGGVAHDFNNLLTAILGHCELLLEDLERDDPRRADIAEIQNAGSRGAGLTRQLLAFSRKQPIEPSLLDLNVVVIELQAMLGRLIEEDVKFVIGLAPGLGSVIADRGEIEQIVMNLAVNARDAMPAGGTLSVETANVELDEYFPKTHFEVAPGRYVALTVTDTGTGMTPEVQARLFEPFFTTKDVGKGTGLGLATVHGIIKRSGGSVNVHSEPGRGTSITVYFPAATVGERGAETPPRAAQPHAGRQTVLVVEDAEGLRELTKRLLQSQGYTVFVAANADEAVSLFEQHPSIDVLLTDVVMPGASGPDLTRRLTERRPALKVIYMSGYTEEAIVHLGVVNPGITFLHKPFTSESLGRKIRDVVDR